MNKKGSHKQDRKKSEKESSISRCSFLSKVKDIGLLTTGTVMASGKRVESDPAAEEEEERRFGPDAHIIQLSVNGTPKEVTVAPQETLAEVLRNHLQLTGTKVVCNRGSCSACTVLLDGEPVNACMVLVLDAVGKEISTVEGLAKNGALHPLQQAFIDHDASQCGYCTPGMLMSSVYLLKSNPHPTPEDIKKAISGNLCRCGTYPHVFKAVEEVSHRDKRQ